MIRVLTLLGNNYGGCLQAVALNKQIKKISYDEVVYLNYTSYMNNKKTIKQLIKKIVYHKRIKKFKMFKNKYLNIEIKENNFDDDGSIYIVGSDQIWNPTMSFDIRKKFYLDFVRDSNRKYSYAASIGDEKLDYDIDNQKKIIKLLNDFKKITLRESSSSKILNGILNKPTEFVLDPTLLLSKNEWDEIKNEKFRYNNYMLVYTLGLDKKNNSYINDFSVKQNKKIIDIFYKKRFENLMKNINNLDPSEFISAISNSDFVVTNSFHGMVFSIIFHKNFLVITRNKMNCRIYDLLKLLKLEDRIIKEEELKNICKMKLFNINYDEVDKILEKEKNRSIEILKSMIK